MRPGIYGACAQRFPGRIHRPPHRTGRTPVRDTTLEFGVSSPVHCPPECLWRVIPKTGLVLSHADFDRHRQDCIGPFPCLGEVRVSEHEGV